MWTCRGPRTISGERRSSSSRTGGMRFGSGAVVAFAPRAGRPTSALIWGRTRPRGWTSRFLQLRCTSRPWMSPSPSGSTGRAGSVPAVRREAERMISPTWALAGLLIVGALESVPLLSRAEVLVTPAGTRTNQGHAARAELTAGERDAFARLGRQTGGRFIWSSNRADNPDLYAVDLTDADAWSASPPIRTSTTSRGCHLMGGQIAFVRSRRPRVSFREAGGW